MKIARLAGLMVIAIFAMSLIAASVATAEPEFKPTGATISGTSGTSILEANNGVDVVTCEKNVTSGTVTSATLVGNVVVHFLGCKSSGEGGTGCTAKSTNTTSEGLILTTTLHGILGLILPKVGTGVGLLLLPSTSGSTEFVTLAGNKCTETTKVTGSVAGEVEPVGKSQTTGTLKFVGAKGTESIKAFDPSAGGSLTAKLTAFSTSASQNTTEAITFSAATEVT